MNEIISVDPSQDEYVVTIPWNARQGHLTQVKSSDPSFPSNGAIGCVNVAVVNPLQAASTVVAQQVQIVVSFRIVNAAVCYPSPYPPYYIYGSSTPLQAEGPDDAMDEEDAEDDVVEVQHVNIAQSDDFGVIHPFTQFPYIS